MSAYSNFGVRGMTGSRVDNYPSSMFTSTARTTGQSMLSQPLRVSTRVDMVVHVLMHNQGRHNKKAGKTDILVRIHTRRTWVQYIAAGSWD